MFEELAYSLKPLCKRLIIICVLVMIAWLGYEGFRRMGSSLEVKHPHPTDPAETTGRFFQSLAGENYQQAYGLLVASLKAATLVGQQSREEGYFPHFARIADYLRQYAGDDFIATMQISADGRRVTFANDITLTVQLETSRGTDKENHYGIRRINEFPIDAVSKMGTEKYYRGLGRAMDSMDGLSGGDEIDDVSEVIRPHPGESDRQTQRRWFESFKRAPQLDTRHSILEWIIKRYGSEPLTRKFLTELAADEKQPTHLQSLARRTLDHYREQE